jgi:hypothetical protein
MFLNLPPEANADEVFERHQRLMDEKLASPEEDLIGLCISAASSPEERHYADLRRLVVDIDDYVAGDCGPKLRRVGQTFPTTCVRCVL